MQVDYFRDPFSIQTEAYKTKSELAQWNNEGLTINATINENFAKVPRWGQSVGRGRADTSNRRSPAVTPRL